MKTSTLALVSLLCLLAAAPLRLAAQETPKARFGEKMEVSEVAIDALVTDPKGNIVLGLGKNDFKVEEDGKPMQLESVQFYSNRRFLESSEKARSLGIDPDAVPSNRYFILFFHDQHQLLPRLAAQELDAGRWAQKWVQADLLPNDYVAVATYDYSLHLYQDFTNDKDDLARALDRAVTGKDPAPVPSPEGVPSLLTHLPTGKALRDATPRIYDALDVLAQAAGSVPGRKNLVLFSLGFGDVDRLGLYTPDPRYYPDMVHTLNDNNVAVYTIDWIPTVAFGPLRDRILYNSLSDLAADTGGRYYYNFVNFLTPLEQISEDTNGYYLLTYRSEHPAGSSGYQKVELSTTDPGLRVRSREGYLYGPDS